MIISSLLILLSCRVLNGCYDLLLPFLPTYNLPSLTISYNRILLTFLKRNFTCYHAILFICSNLYLILNMCQSVNLSPWSVSTVIKMCVCCVPPHVWSLCQLRLKSDGGFYLSRFLRALIGEECSALKAVFSPPGVASHHFSKACKEKTFHHLEFVNFFFPWRYHSISWLWSILLLLIWFWSYSLRNVTMAIFCQKCIHHISRVIFFTKGSLTGLEVASV